jgi:transcription elongation GreA/GreB family factor
MKSGSQPRYRAILTTAILIALVAVIIVQQSRIRVLQAREAVPRDGASSSNTRNHSSPDGLRDVSHAARQSRRAEDPLAQARKEHLDSVERQLEQISAPLVEDMASTMFNADIKKGQSLVTGGYQTADGRNQFTILKPTVVRDSNGNELIQIDSKLIAVSPDDTVQSGLNSLATNAKNTLQHAESWEESDVSSTMEKIQNSDGSEYLGEPKVVVAPGREFTIQMISDDRNSYTLAGTAELSPNGSGVVLKARIQQKEAPEGTR